jgi:NAD-specific glutamate dehydrogenase
LLQARSAAGPREADAGPSAPIATVYAGLIELDRGVRAAARYLVRSGALALDAARVTRLRGGIATLRAAAEHLLTPAELEEMLARRQALEGEGLPAGLAAAVTAAALADRALNVLRVCDHAGVPPQRAGRVVAALGEGTGILWLHQRLREIGAADPWERLALADLRWELLDLQRGLAETVLSAADADDSDLAVAAFLERHEAAIRQVRELQEQAGVDAAPSALVVIASRLRTLRA